MTSFFRSLFGCSALMIALGLPGPSAATDMIWDDQTKDALSLLTMSGHSALTERSGETGFGLSDAGDGTPCQWDIRGFGLNMKRDDIPNLFCKTPDLFDGETLLPALKEEWCGTRDIYRADAFVRFSFARHLDDRLMRIAYYIKTDEALSETSRLGAELLERFGPARPANRSRGVDPQTWIWDRLPSQVKVVAHCQPLQPVTSRHRPPFGSDVPKDLREAFHGTPPSRGCVVLLGDLDLINQDEVARETEVMSGGNAALSGLL